MTTASPPPAPRFRSLFRTLAFSLVIPLVVIQWSLGHGVTPLYALAFGAVFPFGELVYGVVTARRLGIIASFVLLGILVGFGLSFLTGNALFALLKDSVFTGGFGLVFLGSLLTPRPLVYRFNLDFAGRDPAARAAAAALWARPAARHALRLMTLVWGIGLVLEALIRVAVAVTLPLPTATGLSPVIAVVVFGALLVWTILYVRNRRAAAERSAPQAG